MARARSADRLPPSCTGHCRRRACTCGACSCSWCWSACWWPSCTSSSWDAMLNNPVLNGLICFVLVAGILFAFHQVLRLYPEIRWVNAFRIADPGLAISHRPMLLAPMATMLRDRTGSLSLSATSMRSIMDSIGSQARRSARHRPLSRRACWSSSACSAPSGACSTPSSRSARRSARSTPRAADSVSMFDELKTGLAAPLRGMGTAFSSSLLGLGGSLVLGFLELQASHAHGRFYNELEEWLSGITELAPGASHSVDFAAHRLYEAITDMHRAIADLGQRLEAAPPRLPSAGAPQARGGRQGARQGRRPAGAPDARRAEGGARVGRRAGRPAVRGGFRAQGPRRQRARAEG